MQEQSQTQDENELLDSLLEDIDKPELMSKESLAKLLESQSDCV